MLDRFRIAKFQDRKKVVKDSGKVIHSGFLWKFKEKDTEWKYRWVEVRDGGYVMWWPSAAKDKERAEVKDFIDLKNAKLYDQSHVTGVDTSGRDLQKSKAVIYNIKKGSEKPERIGTMKQKSLQHRKYSWWISNARGEPHTFAAEGDHEKEEWWKAIRSVMRSNTEEKERTLADLSVLVSSIPKKVLELDFLKVVGRGAFGRVIKVREVATGSIYVCKVLDKNAVLQHQMLSEVKKEKALLQKVKHPNIVDLIQTFQTKDKLFLVMEFLSGGELFFHMMNEEHRRFSQDRALFYTAQLVLAVGYLHSLQIIHCDLKAENCVLCRDGYMKLTDFGFATSTQGDKKVYRRNGTPVYMAPEMIRLDKEVGYSYPVDVWSLGVLVYAMLTGYFPFHGETPAETLRFACESPLEFPPGVPVSPEAKDLLFRCLERDVPKRIRCEQIKHHKFCAGMNFDDLYNKRIEPPFKPEQTGDNTKYFPTSYENSPYPIKESITSCHDHEKAQLFSGFPVVRSQSTQQAMEDIDITSLPDDLCPDEEYVKRLHSPVTPNTSPMKPTDRTPASAVPPLKLSDAAATSEMG